MKKILKKLFVITPVLAAAALVAGFLPNLLTFADSNDPMDAQRSKSAIVRPGENQSGRISRAEAEAIALSRVNGTIVDFESDDDEYDVEIMLDGIEYDIEIHAYTGKILEVDTDDDDRSEKATREGQARISSEEALQIALQKAPGTMVDLELDDDRYEVEIEADGLEYELEIDAYTGEVLKFDREQND